MQHLEKRFPNSARSFGSSSVCILGLRNNVQLVHGAFYRFASLMVIVRQERVVRFHDRGNWRQAIGLHRIQHSLGNDFRRDDPRQDGIYENILFLETVSLPFLNLKVGPHLRA